MTYFKEPESAKYERLLGKITNVSQLHKFINLVETTEDQVRNDLDDFIDSRRHIQESKKLELERTELSTSLTDSSSLVQLLANSGLLASKITSRVRFLDAERSRVKETVEYVSKVKSLRRNVLTANSAVEIRDWESAAKAIHEIGQLPTTGEFINSVVPSTDVPENPDVVLAKWIEGLTDVFKSEFDKAAESKDVENLTKFFQLFPLINKSSIGLDCYSKFICNIIASQSRSIITNQSQQDKIGFYPAALMKLLEIVSKMLNQHSHIIGKYYGLEHMTGIIERVERETDSQAGLIIDTFNDKRNLTRLIDDIKSYKFPYLSNTLHQSVQSRSSTPPVQGRKSFEQRPSYDGGIGISLIEIGDLTKEFSSLLRYWSLYCKFIAIKWDEYHKSPEESSKQKKELEIPKPILESRFNEKILSKFLPIFEALMGFYIKRSLEESFQIEDIPNLDSFLASKKSVEPENPPVSSIVEDFSLILSSSLSQAVETGQPTTVKNLVFELKTIVEHDYFSIIFKRLKDFYPRSGTVLSLSTTTAAQFQQQQQKQQHNLGSIFMRGANALNQIASGDETRLHTFIILLNSLQLSQNYFTKLINQNITKLPKNFSFGSDSERLETILTNLNEGFNKKISDNLKENVNILFNQVLKNKLKILLTDCFKETDYLLSSFDESENIVTQKFIYQWNQLMVSYYKVLDPKIYDLLIYTIVSTISNLLERKLWSLEGQVNELGSIKLERDYSGIIGEITSSQYNLRDKFLRVTQIVMILGFDDEDDEIDLNWVLTPSERLRARGLRVDRK
jgi:hypothetical protein